MSDNIVIIQADDDNTVSVYEGVAPNANNEAVANISRTGLESARGSASSYAGGFFYATDTGIMYRSDGTSWSIAANLTEGFDAPVNFERKDEKYIITPDFPASSYTKSAALTATDDTTDFLYGTKSVKFVTDNASTGLLATVSLGAPIDLSDQIISLSIKVDDYTKLNDLQLRISSDNFATSNYDYCKPVYTSASQRWAIDGKWVDITINRGGISGTNGGLGQWRQGGTGIADWSSVNAIRFRMLDNSTGAATVRINSLTRFTRPSKGIVSLVFDDARDTHYTVAKSRMDLYKMRGTSGVIAEGLNGSGYMTTAQIKALQEDSGWEIAAHSYTNTSGAQAHVLGYDALTAADGERDVLQIKHWLRKNGMQGTDGLILPHGTWSANLAGTANANPDVIGMMKKYFNYVRTTYSTTWETYPPADRGKLRALTVTETGGDTAASLLALVDLAITNKWWLILTFHNFPTVASTNSDFSKAQFDTFIDGLAAKNVDILPIKEVLDGRKKALDSKASTTHIHTSAQITDLSEAVDDRVSSLIVAGTGITKTYDDTANTLTLSSTGGGTVTLVQPTNHGFLAWNFDPANCVSGTTTVSPAGTAQVLRLYLPSALTVSNIHLWVGAAGVTLANAYVALYQNGSLLTQSSDQSTNWQSSGSKTIAITPQSVTAGTIEVVVWVGSAGTMPALARGISLGVANVGLSATDARFATANTGLTTTAPATLGAKSLANNAWWVAVS